MTTETPPEPVAASDGSDATSGGSWPQRVFGTGWAAVLGCASIPLVILILIIVGGSYLFSGGDKEPDNTATIAAEAGEPDGPNEIDIVSECDLTVKGGLVSESSFDTHGSWKYSVDGQVASVRRKFDAQNAFGANITNTYYCQYNVVTKRITYLHVAGPTGEHTFINERRSSGQMR